MVIKTCAASASVSAHVMRHVNERAVRIGGKRVGELILNRTQTACYLFVARLSIFSSVVGSSKFMLLMISSKVLWMPFFSCLGDAFGYW